MNRKDISKVIAGDFMLFLHNSQNVIEEGISKCENLNFGSMNDNYSHFEIMASDTDIAGMNPPRPYMRRLADLSDDELARIDVYRPFLPPLTADLIPWAPGFNGTFRKLLLRSIMSHLGEYYNFPLIGWYAGAKFADWIGCPGIAEWMYKRNRSSSSHFDVCSTWGCKCWREAVKNCFFLDIDIDGSITGFGEETPASIGGSSMLVRIV